MQRPAKTTGKLTNLERIYLNSSAFLERSFLELCELLDKPALATVHKSMEASFLVRFDRLQAKLKSKDKKERGAGEKELTDLMVKIPKDVRGTLERNFSRAVAASNTKSTY